jgi:ferredoxin-type protein NapF
MKRRELFSSFASVLRGDSQAEVKESVIRPPYYTGLEAFTLCVECEEKKCATTCDENIIIIQEDGSPRLDLTTSMGCTFCDECADVCEANVLQVDKVRKIDALIEIDLLKCLSWHDTMCFSCKEPCMENAIEFLGMFRPSINQDRCTSCGFCVYKCPTNAITIKGLV